MSGRKTTTSKGLGWKHQQQRARLLAAMPEGKRCWWCGEPMFTDPMRNPDGKALAADHSLPRAVAGPNGLADRLLHGSCNSARKAGAKDHARPAVKARRRDGDAPKRACVFDWGT